MMLLLNALSLNMLAAPSGAVTFRELPVEEAARFLAAGFESAIGHADTARLVGTQLGVEVPVNRTTVALTVGATAVVAQYRGPRLPEGATELPEGATITYYFVEVWAHYTP